MNIDNPEELSDENRKELLEHLGAQYKIFREEVRSYLGFSAASTTLLAILLFSELTLARGKDAASADPKLLILIPLSLVWYGGLLAIFVSNVAIAQKYSELLERKMNNLLKHEVFNFQSNYKKRNSTEIVWFIIVSIAVAIIPITCALIAGYIGIVEGYSKSPFCALIFVGICLIAFLMEFIIVLHIRISRRRMNNELMGRWEDKLKAETEPTS